MPKIHTPTDLEALTCMVFTLPEYRSTWVFKDKNDHLSRVQIKSDISISSALALKECALRGMGPLLLADWLVEEEIKAGRLIRILKQYQVTAEEFDTAAWLLYPSRNFLPNKTRVMIDFLKEKHEGKRDTGHVSL